MSFVLYQVCLKLLHFLVLIPCSIVSESVFGDALKVLNFVVFNFATGKLQFAVI